MSVVDAKIAVATADVFETGDLEVKSFTVPANGDWPPVDLYMFTPVTKGTYPVLLFCHGFMLFQNVYIDILTHVASYGYIVVAPKFYGYLDALFVSQSDEIQRAAKVVQWMSSTTGLPTALAAENLSEAYPDIENFALAGHSRGGKTAFSIALGRIGNKKSSGWWPLRSRARSVKSDDPTHDLPKFKAVIGIDPDAGTSKSQRTDPKILEYESQCFDMSSAVSIIATGYSDKWCGIFPPFAAKGVSGAEFFHESKPPACYFLAKYYGHCDMVDEWMAKIASLVCASCGTRSRVPMRKSVGGIMVAFLKAYLGVGNGEDLNAILKDPSLAPTTLDPVISEIE